jgi:ribonuclease G
VDDAVAKIDGYIISVAGGGAHVGEKRMVRIEEAGRTSATAVLIDDHGSANGSTAEPKPARKSKARKAKDDTAGGKAKEDSANGDAAASEEEAGEDAVESTPRRRGRRGGRRRSAATAEATSSD